MVLNLIAVVLSAVSLVTSVLVALRQTSMMRHTNELPIFVELTNEFRGTEFQEAHGVVMRGDGKVNDLKAGIAGLPEDERLAVTRVTAFFITLGALVVWGLADEALVVYMFGFQAVRTWTVLETTIRA